MIAVFYDRKNRREVRSDELTGVNVVRNILVGDDDDMVPTGRRYVPTRAVPEGELMFPRMYQETFGQETGAAPFNSFKEEETPFGPKLHEAVIGTLGYKSKECPKEQNWDLFCTENDLAFLRMEEEPE